MNSSGIILETDQNRCYGQDGQLVACMNSGQDASFGKASPRAGDQRFQTRGPIVRDTLSGAVWHRDANLPEFPLTWKEAQAFVDDMRDRRAYGYDDWQLPPRRLLFSLVSHQQINPVLVVGHPFHNVFNGYYWTADSCRRPKNQAWTIHLGGGRVQRGMKHGSYMVWPVSISDVGGDETMASDPDRFAIDGPCAHDGLTGLTWHLSADPVRGPLDWQQALDSVAEMNACVMGGHADWRVPTIRELESLVNLDFHSPALPDGHPFTDVRDAYWSSTTSVYEPRYAWTLYIRDGLVGVGFKPGQDFYLWPVRG